MKKFSSVSDQFTGVDSNQEELVLRTSQSCASTKYRTGTHCAPGSILGPLGDVKINRLVPPSESSKSIMGTNNFTKNDNKRKHLKTAMEVV